MKQFTKRTTTHFFISSSLQKKNLSYLPNYLLNTTTTTFRQQNYASYHHHLYNHSELKIFNSGETFISENYKNQNLENQILEKNDKNDYKNVIKMEEDLFYDNFNNPIKNFTNLENLEMENIINDFTKNFLKEEHFVTLNLHFKIFTKKFQEKILFLIYCEKYFEQFEQNLNDFTKNVTTNFTTNNLKFIIYIFKEGLKIEKLQKINLPIAFYDLILKKIIKFNKNLKNLFYLIKIFKDKKILNFQNFSIFIKEICSEKYFKNISLLQIWNFILKIENYFNEIHIVKNLKNNLLRDQYFSFFMKCIVDREFLNHSTILNYNSINSNLINNSINNLNNNNLNNNNSKNIKNIDIDFNNYILNYFDRNETLTLTLKLQFIYCYICLFFNLKPSLKIIFQLFSGYFINNNLEYLNIYFDQLIMNKEFNYLNAIVYNRLPFWNKLFNEFNNVYNKDYNKNYKNKQPFNLNNFTVINRTILNYLNQSYSIKKLYSDTKNQTFNSAIYSLYLKLLKIAIDKQNFKINKKLKIDKLNFKILNEDDENNYLNEGLNLINLLISNNMQITPHLFYSISLFIKTIEKFINLNKDEIYNYLYLKIKSLLFIEPSKHFKNNNNLNNNLNNYFEELFFENVTYLYLNDKKIFNLFNNYNGKLTEGIIKNLLNSFIYFNDYESAYQFIDKYLTTKKIFNNTIVNDYNNNDYNNDYNNCENLNSDNNDYNSDYNNDENVNEENFNEIDNIKTNKEVIINKNFTNEENERQFSFTNNLFIIIFNLIDQQQKNNNENNLNMINNFRHFINLYKECLNNKLFNCDLKMLSLIGKIYINLNQMTEDKIKNLTELYLSFTKYFNNVYNNNNVYNKVYNNNIYNNVYNNNYLNNNEMIIFSHSGIFSTILKATYKFKKIKTKYK
ncbi:hypothetical protein ABK040_010478 [Willaertia magna]